MSYEVNSKREVKQAKIEALARKCRLDEEDEARALSVYHGMIDAIAERVAGHARERRDVAAVVYVAAYQHRFGVDLSAHESRDNAEARLLSIAWNQCMRDPEIRAAVDARFGPLVSEEPPLEPPFEADLDREADAETHGEVDLFVDGASASAEARGLDDRGDDPMPRLGATSDSATALVPSERDPSPGSGAWDWPRRSGHGSAAESVHHERRRTFCEQLLEEWPSFAKGESLWIAECAVEKDEQPSEWHDVGSDAGPDIGCDGR